ncbi:MAG: DUF1080 domain-containing protein [Planctomycetes bacterium]|nr:DUF1080 domain-containing protein [Planctomycetota bacterium]
MRTVLKLGVLAVAVCVAGARAEDKPAAKPPEGFAPLFDGKTLGGWKASGKAEAWAADGGAIVCKGGGGGYLLTEKEYGDFEFRCEYRWEKKGGNSGVALRTPEKGDPAYAGMEIQLIDDEGWPGKLADYQHTGSIYDVQPAKAAVNKPIGEWNSVKIVCKGRKVTVEQNGGLLVDANLDDYKAKQDKNHPGLGRTKGHIGFQSYNIRVEFRNVWIKELK